MRWVPELPSPPRRISGEGGQLWHTAVPRNPSDPEPGTNTLWPAPPHPTQLAVLGPTVFSPARLSGLPGTTAGALRIGRFTAGGSRFLVCKRIELNDRPSKAPAPRHEETTRSRNVLLVQSLPSLGKLSSNHSSRLQDAWEPTDAPSFDGGSPPRVGAPLSARGVPARLGPGTWGPDLSCTGQKSRGTVLGDPDDTAISSPTVISGLEGWPP